MAVIALYAPDETDFSTLGLGALTPSECTVTWQAAGAYELTLAQPIDETNRWAQLANGCIISAPVPVRESPLYEYGVSDGGSGTVTRNVWQVVRTSVGLNMRTGYGTGHKIIRHYKNGTQVIELGRMMVGSRMWIHCTTVEGGETGYMSTKYLELVETKTETISGGRPENQRVLQLTQSRRQLFRVYSTEQDSDAGVVTVKARHVFYDLAGNMLNEEYSPEKISGAAAAQEVFAQLRHGGDFTLYTEGLTQGSVTGEYAYKNPVEILLDPDEGIVSQCKCQIIRDNFDVHLIDDIESDMGVTVRRGKNLVGVTATTDESDVVTQIKPCGKDADGNEFWLADAEGDDRYVNSAHINKYAVVRTVKKDYDVSLVKKDEDNETTFRDNASGRSAARAKLRELAEQDFADGADLPSYGLEVDFVLLQDAEGYEQYAGLQAVHPYDTVTVIDSLIGLTARLRVTGYEWDALAGQYADVTLGELDSLEQTVYSYNLPDGGISGTKIAPGTASGSILRDATIQYAKISVAAIEQLSAQSITALTAYLQEVIAGSVTTDALYAALAEINKATIGTADIDWANIDRLTAVIAELSSAEIGTADIDWAHIKDLATDTAIITQGVGGQLMISRLAVTEANLVSLTTGELVVKGEDGSFYAISVDADGNIVTTLKQIANSDVKDLSINAGEKLIEGTVTAACLNATDIFADSAVIRQLIAANLDVDTLFAREATVNLLRTMQIVGDKSIEIIAGQVEQNATDIAVNNIHTGAEPPEEPVPDGKLWVDTAQDPNVIRRWLGQDVSTERDYTASASGNPVETPPGTASFDSLQSVLLPVQAGSGDPSPDNIRPISGRTGVNLTRCGVNIFPPGEEKTGTVNGITFVSDGNGKYTLNGTSTGSAAFVINLVKPVRIPDAYVGYFHMLNSVANGYFTFGFIENGTQTSFSGATIINRIRSIDEFGSLLRGRTIDAVQLYVNGSGRVFDNFTLAPMLLQTGTLTDYKPYTGDTYAADFGQTIYGGTMDWTTGVLTVTHKYLEFEGTENWVMESSGIWAGNNGNTFGIWLNGTELGISNDLITASSTYIPVRRNATDDWKDNCVTIASGGASVNFIRTSYASVDDWKAYLADQYAAGTPVQIAYKLATPTTIQLSPATVAAIKGVNTLHTDADSVSVAYTASGWEIVNDLSEINDVSNRLLAQQAAAQQAIDQLATAITVDSDGAHFYKPGYRAQNEVRIDQDSVDILVGGSVNSSFVAGGLILGNYMLWHPEAAGGLAFNLI